MSSVSLSLEINTEAASKAIADLSEAIAALDESLKNRIQLFFESSEIFEHLFTFEIDHGIAGAGNALVSLNPSDGFSVFLSALRAGEIDGLMVEWAAHEKSFL